MGNKRTALSRLSLFLCVIALFVAGKYCTSSVKEANRQRYFQEVDEAFARIEQDEEFSENISESWDYDKKLADEVERFSRKLPQKVDEVSLWDSYTLDEDALMYHYIIDDTKVDMNKLDVTKIKESMLNDYKRHYGEMVVSIEGCIATNRCIRYRYTGETTKKEIEYLLLPSELQNIRPK